MKKRLIAGLIAVAGFVGVFLFDEPCMAAPGGEPSFESDVIEVKAPKEIIIHKVKIHNRFGNITVTGQDQQTVKIRSYKQADTAKILERLVVSLTPDAKGSVQITTALKKSKEKIGVRAGSIRIDLEVSVPRTALVDAALWHGNVRIQGVDNGAALQVDRGTIWVQHVSGLIASQNREGRQEFVEIFGDLDVESLSGDVVLESVQGRYLRARLVRGNVRATQIASRNIQIQSIYGDIDVWADLFPGGTHKISTFLGDVSFRYYAEQAVPWEVYAHRARIDVDLQPVRVGAGHWQGGVLHGEGNPAGLDIFAKEGTVVVKQLLEKQF